MKTLLTAGTALLALPLFTLAAPGDTCSSSKVARASATGHTIAETAVSAGNFKTLVAGLGAAGLVDALNGHDAYTVFAPSDAAFAKLPQAKIQELLKPENKALLSSILTYHVIPGRVPASQVVKTSAFNSLNGQRLGVRVEEGTVSIDGAQVVATDIECSNGIIHVIDAVMLPATLDIVDTAVQAGDFGTLAAALGAGQLVDALKGEGPFTVFAPKDSAFAKLPKATLESLLKPENRHNLQSILKLHVVPGRVYADQAVQARKAKTLQGEELNFKIQNGSLYVNGSKIVANDIQTSNGVIHVIDTVLLPQG